MVADDHLHHVELDSSFDVRFLVLTGAERLDLRGLCPYSRHLILQPAEVCPVADPQELGPLNEVGEVEVLNIVAGHNVWIDLHDELLPCL